MRFSTNQKPKKLYPVTTYNSFSYKPTVPHIKHIIKPYTKKKQKKNYYNPKMNMSIKITTPSLPLHIGTINTQ